MAQERTCECCKRSVEVDSEVGLCFVCETFQTFTAIIKEETDLNDGDALDDDPGVASAAPRRTDKTRCSAGTYQAAQPRSVYLTTFLRGSNASLCGVRTTKDSRLSAPTLCRRRCG